MSDDHDTSNDPRNDEIRGETGMPASFVDRPDNLPGDQPDDQDDTPPPKALADGTVEPD